MGKLYIVPTPIGNLADITLRALEVLKMVDEIVCEDTRVSRKLLEHYEIDKPLLSYHEHNEAGQLERILKEVEDKDVAVISDAGTPGVSDPGFRLVREAVKRGVEVVVLPGPTAVIPALVGSGLPTDSFVFLGFLPKKSGQRRRILEELKRERRTLVFYESPYRLRESLADMWEVWGERQVCVAREISKKFEEFIRMSLAVAVEELKKHELMGEVVIVVEGRNKEESVWSREKVAAEMVKELSKGKAVSVAAKKVAKKSGWKKKQVYELGLGRKKASEGGLEP